MNYTEKDLLHTAKVIDITEITYWVILTAWHTRVREIRNMENQVGH